MYSINRLEIDNFKLMESKRIIDFSNVDLVVLDGPNGYGKTTIFDAIEILVKGSRNLEKSFNSEYKEGNKPVVYAANENRPIVLKGEFINEEGNKIILKRIIENPSKIGKISDLQNRFSLYKLNDFEEYDGEVITQEDINTIFELYPNEDVYNLMYYIQQEETLFFLKENENRRKEILNTLFNMERECQEQNKILKLRDKLNAGKRKIKAQIVEIDKEIASIKIDNTRSAEYKILIKDKDIIWDKENLELDYDTFQNSIMELERIKLLREKIKDFESLKHNKKIDFIVDKKQEDILRASFILKKELQEHSKIIENINLCSIYEKFINFLKASKYKSMIEMIENKSEIKYVLESKFDIEKFMLDISHIDKSNRNNSQLDSLIININDIRKNLEKEYQKYNIKNNEGDICPLCGYDYNSADSSLTDKILEKEEYFFNQLDNNKKELNLLILETRKEFINPMIEFLETKINEKRVNIDYKNLLDKSISNELRVNKFKEFFSENNIGIEKYELTANNYTKEQEETNLDLLKEELKSRKKILEEDWVLINEKELNRIFSNIFEDDIDKVKKLSIIDITNKKLYIEHISSREEYIKRNKKIKIKQILEKKYSNLDEEYTKSKEIAEIYRKVIDNYSKNIIKMLQIPLYIYSGKIIQDYQCGLGVFIKSEENEQQIRLKFVNTNESKHDLLNKFSSGQLSGLILSIMLSLNKVFSSNSLNTLLIDDPLQSMDDINMTSFVELLRNEFGKSQIILSTHDERISRYIRYKFEKFNLKTMRYNVKEKLKI